MTKTGSQGPRTKCQYCDKSYVYTTSLDTHQESKHGLELLRDFPGKYNPIAEARLRGHEAPHGPECTCGRKHAPLTNAQKVKERPRDLETRMQTIPKGIEALRNIARRLRSHVDMNARERLARELENIAAALAFVNKDLQSISCWEAMDKAEKWDTLVRILPTIESFLKLALETEAQRVKEDVQGSADVQD